MGSRDRRARRGRPSLLEEGWIETDPSGKTSGLSWSVDSPIGTYLALRGVGLSQREACLQSGVNRSTVTGLLEAAKPWLPVGGDLTPSAIRPIEDEHRRRAVAFYAAEERRKGNPKAVGLTSIVSAAQGGDWRAGLALVKLLYKDEFADRIEHTGADGKPLAEIDAARVAERVGAMLRNLVDADDDAGDPEEVNLDPQVNPEPGA